MIPPFRYDEGVTIYINGGRIATGLLSINTYFVVRLGIAVEILRRRLQRKARSAKGGNRI